MSSLKSLVHFLVFLSICGVCTSFNSCSSMNKFLQRTPLLVLVKFPKHKFRILHSTKSGSAINLPLAKLDFRLFGTKRGAPGKGTIEIYDEQTTIPDLNILKVEETISIIREIIGYPTYDVNLILTEDKEMQQTNLETRGVDRPTDILSFQFQDVVDEPGVLAEPDFDIPEYYNLGDMMIDVPYVIRRCVEDKEFNESVGGDDEVEIEVDEEYDYVGDDDRGVSGVMSTIYDPEERIKLLLVHGMLHLVGYDHIEDDEYDLMVTKEEQVIKELQKRLNADWCDIEE